ncbi:MAG: fatty acid--CoA ligase family protein, partial [Betaproteobacteria bacterium]
EIGGSELPLPLYERAVRQLCPNIICAYGATETGRISTAPMTALVAHPGAVGYTNPGVDAEAVDRSGAPLPAGAEGTLRIRSDLCVSSYFGNDALSANVFRDGWVYTNDIATVGADGLITMTGRSGDVINKGGTKVSPAAIEAVLLTYPGITQAAAFGAPDAVGLTQIWSAVVSNVPVERDRLRAFCVERLGYTAPIGFIVTDMLPRTDTGKVRREELVKVASDAMRRPPS